MQMAPDLLPSEDEIRKALGNIEPLWDVLFPAEQERLVRLLVEEVIVNPDALTVKLRTCGLRGLVAELQDGQIPKNSSDGQTLDIHVPIQFKVRGGRKDIILPENAKDQLPTNKPLVLAIARAYKWQAIIDSEKISGIKELSRQHGMDHAYVSRTMKLATLAPDIIETILAGNEPSGLSLAKLNKNLPMGWDQQRKALGFNS